MRIPEKIKHFKIKEDTYSISSLISVLRSELKKSTSSNRRIGMLLSGGIDSTILLYLMKELNIDFTCVTIGRDRNEDVLSAIRLMVNSKEKHILLFPSKEEIDKAKYESGSIYQGDDAVYLALKFLSKLADVVIATDGADELMGGYWNHWNDKEVLNVFQRYWGRLETEHLSPMYKSANLVGIDVDWIYLHDEVVRYISRIPLLERVKGGVGKYLWKRVAGKIGVPKWVINRKKRGFCDALS